MKNYLIIPLLILSVGFCQQKKTDEPNPMKGVKTVTRFEYVYEEKFGKYNWVPKEKTKMGWDLQKFIYKYDSNGNRTETLIYDSDGSLRNKWIYK